MSLKKWVTPALLRLVTPGTGNSVIAPVVVIRPTSWFAVFVNQRLPSGPGGDPGDVGVGGDGELGDGPGRRDPADRVGLGEPDVAVGPCGDPSRGVVALGERELADRARRGHVPDLADARLGEPDVAVVPERQGLRRHRD
jgi:hypothetical protein